MKKLILAVLFIAGAINGAEGDSKSNNSTSKFGPTTKAAALYAAGTAVFGGIGHVLHNFTDAAPYEICKKGAYDSAVNIVKYPQEFYSASMAEYYASKSADGLLRAASVCSAPFRSLFFSVAMPIEYIRQVVKANHELKDPTLNGDKRWNLRSNLDYEKQIARTQIRRAPVAALVGLGLPYLYGKIKQHKFQQPAIPQFNDEQQA